MLVLSPGTEACTQSRRAARDPRKPVQPPLGVATTHPPPGQRPAPMMTHLKEEGRHVMALAGEGEESPDHMPGSVPGAAVIELQAVQGVDGGKCGIVISPLSWES